jgi:hypothetical protein
MEKPASEKLSHAAVDYEAASHHLPNRCGVCAHFIAVSPPRCEGVQSPIAAQAWCKRFERKSRIAQAMKER